MGTMNGIDESFDGEGYLRSLVEIGLVKFAAGQLERGESGNIHLQYYIQRERQTTFATIKRQICDRSHWEVARGTLAQCVAYDQGRYPYSRAMAIWYWIDHGGPY